MEKDCLRAAGLLKTGTSMLLLRDELEAGVLPKLGVRYAAEVPSEDQKMKEFREISELMDSADHLRTQREWLQRMRCEYESLKQALTWKEGENSRLLEEVKDLHNEKTRAEDLESRLQALELTCKKLAEERDYYEDQFSRLSGEGLGDQISQYRAQLMRLTHLLDMTRIEAEKSEKTISLLRMQLFEQEQEANSKITADRIKLNVVEESRLKLQQELDYVRQKLQKLILQQPTGPSDESRELQALKEVHKQLRKEFERKEECYLALEEEINRLKVQSHREQCGFISRLQHSQLTNLKQQAQIEELNTRLLEKDSRLKIYDEDNGRLRKQIEELNATLRHLSVQLEHFKANQGSAITHKQQQEIEDLREKLKRVEEWKLVDRQHRFDLQSLRHSAKAEKDKEIRRIDELIESMGVKFTCKRFPYPL